MSEWTNSIGNPDFPEEDFERISELDKMWLLEKDQEMFVEWQMWEEEQERLNRIPAKIEILTPIKEKHEADTDAFSF